MDFDKAIKNITIIGNLFQGIIVLAMLLEIFNLYWDNTRSSISVMFIIAFIVLAHLIGYSAKEILKGLKCIHDDNIIKRG